MESLYTSTQIPKILTFMLFYVYDVHFLGMFFLESDK